MKNCHNVQYNVRMDGCFYFAFGVNMCRNHMDSLCPGIELTGQARLPNHRFQINRLGYATVIPYPDATVYGVLWQITTAHECALDRFEGIDQGMYVKRQTEVIALPEEVPVQAMMYVATDSMPGFPNEPYLRRVITAAHREDLPINYIQTVREWLDPPSSQ